MLEKDFYAIQAVFSFFLHTSCSYHLRFLGKTHAVEQVPVLHSLFLKAILRAPASSVQQCLKQCSFVSSWWSDFWQPF